jgi:hypothetical protein
MMMKLRSLKNNIVVVVVVVAIVVIVVVSLLHQRVECSRRNFCLHHRRHCQ